MGGPSNLFEVETFLKNMFYDEHILRIKSNFLRRIVGSFIANKRLKSAQENYKKIGGKSPITPITFSLTQKLNQRGDGEFFTYAMRYTPPYSSMVIRELQQKRIDEVILLSLYPQYSTTTTLSSLQDFKKTAKELGFEAKISEVARFYEHPLFLKCIQKRIQEALDAKDSKEFILILSAHGLPQSIIDEGDPYQRECEHHAKILEDYLRMEGIEFERVILSYQSRLGPMKWIEPFTEKIIEDLNGKKILIYPLAFSIDNSETHFELDIELRQKAKKIGIKEFLLCSCPNDSDEFVDLILDLSKGEKR